MNNKSPWLDQIKNISSLNLSENESTDVLVIGGGISGVVTAYYLLKNTDLSITLVEAKNIASGATGHNAGQMVSYFERQISDLAKEYGLNLAVNAQRDINASWYLIEEIFYETGIKTKVSFFTGFAGIQDFDELLVHLQNALIYKKAGLIFEKLSIAQDSEFLNKIPEKYHQFFSLISRKNLQDYLETKSENYEAMISVRKGVMNSAAFCIDLLDFIQKNYSQRIKIYENTRVNELNLFENKSICKTENFFIESGKTILCTNGFENIKIINKSGDDIDSKFHHLVKGCIGYMAGYLEKDLREPTAISYLPESSKKDNKKFDEDPYFYLTRRDFDLGKERFNLICVGGPEAIMDDSNNYKREHPYPAEAMKSINDFIKKEYKFAPKGDIEYKYKWHGLMGYTPNGLRLIGPEPLNQNLLYNLGCNGIGILPSIFGGKKVSLMIRGEKFEESLFDPKNQKI